MLGENDLEAKVQLKDEKVKWKNSTCPCPRFYKELLGIDGEATEFEWNILHRIFDIAD